MNEQIEYLLNRTHIIETINRLFISTDNRDWDAVKHCFASSVLFDMTSMGGGDPQQLTPDAIVAMWDAGLKPIQAIHHQAGNYLVSIEDDRADAFCYGIASHYRPTESGANTRTFVGSYDFKLDRIGAQWKISGFRFNLKFIDGNMNL